MSGEHFFQDEGTEYDVLSAEEMEGLLSLESTIIRTPEEQRQVANFKSFFNGLGARHFKAEEFLFLGGRHNGNGTCSGKNALPEPELWPNLSPLVTALDALREQLACPIFLTCIYRNPSYNRCVGGVEQSQHRRFTAADCVFRGVSTRACAGAARQLRIEGVFSGGVGLYSSFVHIDVRGHDTDWSKI